MSILRVCLADSCPEVTQNVLRGLSGMIDHFMDGVHMVVEQLLAVLKPLLKNRQRAIRFEAIRQIRKLMEIDSDRNGIMMETMQDALMLLLRDSYPDIRMVCL